MNNQQLIEALQYYNEQDDYKGSKDEPTANRWAKRGLKIGAGIGAITGGIAAHKAGVPFGKALKKVAVHTLQGAGKGFGAGAASGVIRDNAKKQKYKAQ